MAAAHRGHDRGGASRLQSVDAHQIGVVEVVAGVVVQQIAHHEQAELGQAGGGLRAHPAHLAEGHLEAQGGARNGRPGGCFGRCQAQPGRGQRQHGSLLLAPLVQLLAALGHQGLALADTQLLVELEAAGELAEAGRRWGARRRLAQRAGEKSAESLAAAHQVGAPSVGLQLQGLLQGSQPALVEGGLGSGGGSGLGLSWCHSRSASSL